MLHAALLANAPTGCPLPTKAIGSSIFASIARPIADVLAAVYSVIPNYAVAIMVLSVLWMLIIAPLTLKSTRSMLAMQKLQPELKKLQAEYKNDRQAFAQAQMDLFKEHNVSPFGSCLPMLLPLPVFFALFRVIDGLSAKTTHVINGVAVKCPTPNYLSPHTAMFKAIYHADGVLNAFGLNLAKDAWSSHSSIAAALPYFLLLLLMIGTQYLQTVRMMSRNPSAANNPQANLMKYLPIIFGIIFIKFPAGVILYYTMSNICRIAQQELMYLYDPKVRALANRELREVETEIDQIERGTRRRVRPSGDAAPRSRFRDLLNDYRDQAQQRASAPAPSGGGTKGGPTPRRSDAQQRGNRGKGAPDKPSRSASTPATARAKAPSQRNGNGSNGAGRSQAPPRAGTGTNGNGTGAHGRAANGTGAHGNGNGSSGNGSNGNSNGNGSRGNGSKAGPNAKGAGGNGAGATGGSRTGATGARPGARNNRRRRGR